MPHAAASPEFCAAGVPLTRCYNLFNRWQSAEITFFAARDYFVESAGWMRNVMEKENSDDEVLPWLLRAPMEAKVHWLARCYLDQCWAALLLCFCFA